MFLIITGDPLSKRRRRRLSDPHVALLPLWCFLQYVGVVPLQCTSLDAECCAASLAPSVGEELSSRTPRSPSNGLEIKQLASFRSIELNPFLDNLYISQPSCSRSFTAFRSPIKPFFCCCCCWITRRHCLVFLLQCISFRSHTELRLPQQL